MNDRAGLAASQDYGRDEEAAVKLLKKHKVLPYQFALLYFLYRYTIPFYLQSLQEEVKGYSGSVEELGEVARGLIASDHFDSINISARKV